jgi:toxin ParE1/3/4
MKMLPVEYRQAAAADIDGIFAYVLEKSADVVTAIRFTDRVYARCQSIGNAPHAGVARPDLGLGIRMVPFERTAINLYIVEDDAVWITNVFAGGRDYAALLRDKP